MALTGTFLRNLDEKQRVAVPKKLRDQFDQKELSTLYVSPGTEQSLALYSPAEFERLAQRLTEKSSSKPEFRNYSRLFFARTEEVPVDSQGRIRIPEWLVQLAQLKKDIILVGVHDHAEIWDQDLWKQFLASHVPAFDTMASSAFE